MTHPIPHRALPDWLEPQAQALDGMLRRQQLPQALLVHGVPGTGRGLLSAWLAARLLGSDPQRLTPCGAAADGGELLATGHPDFLRVEPAADKRTIAIDQVRELIGFMQLKSHQGGARVVLIARADTMTVAAANSLLKTLEEPPAGSSIILVSANLSRLPATIVSRCHRLRISAPPRDAAIAWLAGLEPATDWEDLLDCAGGAPLLALSLQQGGFLQQAAAYGDDLTAVRTGRLTPIAVARRWAQDDLEVVLRWLYWRIGRAIRDLMGSPRRVSGPEALQKPAKISNIPALFAHLRNIEQLQRHRASALNIELQLGALLAAWCADPIDRESET